MSKHQTCKRCPRIQRFEFSIKDEIWNLIPEKWHNRVLCIECFLELLEENIVGKLKISLEDFEFLGIAGLDIEKLSGVLLDRNPKDV